MSDRNLSLSASDRITLTTALRESSALEWLESVSALGLPDGDITQEFSLTLDGIGDIEEEVSDNPEMSQDEVFEALNIHVCDIQFPASGLSYFLSLWDLLLSERVDGKLVTYRAVRNGNQVVATSQGVILTGFVELAD